MSARARAAQATTRPYVSTGHLPPAERVRALVAEAHKRFKSDTDGENSKVYPALARVPSKLFGICVVGTNGDVYRGRRRGARVHDHERLEAVHLRPGVRGAGRGGGAPADRRQRHRTGVQLARGHRTQSGRADEPDGELGGDRHDQPGAGARLSRPSGSSSTRDCRGSPAARCRSTTRCTFRRPRRTTGTSRIARLLQSYGRVYMDPAEAVDLYTKQCSLNVSARDLAVMGATLADGGVNPITKERVVERVGLPLRPGRDDHRRALRDLGRLALRHRTAGQERHRRRDRHRLSRQGRARDLRARRSTGPETASRGSSWPSSSP